MEPVAVIKVADGVKRAELVSLHQDHDEPFRTIVTRVRSKAKLVISLLLVSVNVEKKLQAIQKKQLRRNACKCM